MGDSKEAPPSLPLHLEPELEVVPLWIDGVAASAARERTFPVYSAKQEKNVYKAQSADAEDARRAADVALKSFDTWRDTSPYYRQALILKAADIFEARKAEAVEFQVQETSCEATWANFNVGYGLVVMREIASRVTSVFGAMPRTASDNNLCLVFKEPIGPSLLISP
jgi:acyl-CoA reductase-like NAD-dependent aldehyde dehydrogenase